MAMKNPSVSPVGDWNSSEPAWSDVLYTVKTKGTQYVVKAVDTYSGEQAQVSGVDWDGMTLTFTEHWPNDRVSRCTLRILSPERAEMSHAYTEQFSLVRASALMAQAA